MVDTTVMRESMVGDKWIYDMCQLNPVQRVFNDAGQWTGDILTGPVRLSFCETLVNAGPAMKNDPKSRIVHATTALFTPYTDFSLFWEEYYRICASDFADMYDAPSQTYYGLDNPIFEQSSKLKYTGYTPGLKALNTSSEFKPPIVDSRGLPITDDKKVYAGVWAILGVRAYASGKGKPRKGPRFGLQSCMLIADDKPLGGAGVDAKQQFKGVQVRPPASAPTAAFAAGNGQPQAPGAPLAGSYGAPPAVAGGPGYAPPAPPPASPPADDWMSGLGG